VIRSKYHNKRTGAYASKREANRAAELHLLQKAGLITDLQEQVKFTLIPKQEGERECSYIADFTYLDSDGVKHCEDVKGFRTKEYRIKKKLLLWTCGIRIEEV
jgi:hypothetical protein